MKPYYSESGISLYFGDCRELLPELGTFNAIITDPPYGDTSLKWDSMVRGWLNKAAIATSSLWCFGSFRMFMELARISEISDWKLAQEIVWEKQNGSSFHADRFKRVHELAVQFYRGEWGDLFKSPVMTLDATSRTTRRKQRPPHMGIIADSTYASEDGGPRLMRSVIYEPNCHGFAEHPTQKPLGILTPLLQYSVPEGGNVCDPFCGSGSTLVAAKALHLNAVGIEIDEKYCEIAARRLSQDVLNFSEV